MEFKNIELQKLEAGIWILKMNRPQVLNALNRETLQELDQAFCFLMEQNPLEVRVLLLTGSGEKAFVAGADIKEMLSLDSEQARVFAQTGQKIFRQIEMLRFPVLAVVNGFALGGGLELALSCDFIIASENARFGLPEVSLGLMPGFGGCVRLARVVGLNRARQMTMTGDLLTASEAFQVGLVQKIETSAELMNQALKMAQTLSSRGPLGLAAVKRTILDGYDMNMDGALQYESEGFSKLFQSSDCREGMGAFVEKRKAEFQGK